MEADQIDQQIANNTRNPFFGDDRLHVKFFSQSVLDEAESAKEGRPIFHDEDFIQIMTPGDATNIISRPVQPLDLRRFARKYEDYKAGKSQDTSGTPLSAWPLVTRSQVEELAYFKVKTVEQLAALSDSVAQKFMGINTLREKAKDFLRAAKETAPLTAMRKELEERDSTIQSQQQAIQELQQAVAKLQQKR